MADAERILRNFAAPRVPTSRTDEEIKPFSLA